MRISCSIVTRLYCKYNIEIKTLFEDQLEDHWLKTTVILSSIQLVCLFWLTWKKERLTALLKAKQLSGVKKFGLRLSSIQVIISFYMMIQPMRMLYFLPIVNKVGFLVNFYQLYSKLNPSFVSELLLFLFSLLWRVKVCQTSNPTHM